MTREISSQNRPDPEALSAPWRLLAHPAKGEPLRIRSTDYPTPVEFDELVVGDWLHVEQMDTRAWWARIGPITVDIEIHPDGTYGVLVLDALTDSTLARYQASVLQQGEPTP